jgi:hypothetical protein
MPPSQSRASLGRSVMAGGFTAMADAPQHLVRSYEQELNQLRG